MSGNTCPGAIIISNLKKNQINHNLLNSNISNHLIIDYINRIGNIEAMSSTQSI